MEDTHFQSLDVGGNGSITSRIVLIKGKRVQENILDKKRAGKEIPQLKALKPKASLESIISGGSRVTGSGAEQIRAKGGKMNQARAMAIYLVRDFSGLSGRALGDYFGGVPGAATTMCYKKFYDKLSTDKSLQDLVSKTKKGIFNF